MEDQLDMVNEAKLFENKLLRFLIGYAIDFDKQSNHQSPNNKHFLNKGTEEFFVQQVALIFPRNSVILEKANSA